MQKSKIVPEEALQITVKRKAVQCKGEKEGYTHLNAVSKNSKEKKESLPQ